METLEKIINETKNILKTNHPNMDITLLDRAIEFSQKIHIDKKRLSGEDFFTHSAEVALIIASELKLDLSSVVAGYLHDVVENEKNVSIDIIEKEFGKEIAKIIDGVTKLTNTPYESKDEQRAASFRKMIQISTFEDMRVLFVKLADRLHNMRTLKFLPEEKQVQKAIETKELYAPIAHRLGLYKIKSELEDLSFKYLDRENFTKIKNLLDEKKVQREEFIVHTIKSLENVLKKLNINGKVDGRAKHIFSIYEKMHKSNKQFDELFDITAFRIIVQKKEECYIVLGEIHSTFKTIVGRFKDYISVPKSNNYQSLHTSVFSKEGKIIEIQIRTEEMHLIAESGFAAHWAYKERKGNIEKEQEELNTLKTIVKTWLQEEYSNDKEAMFLFTNELKSKEIYVYTPGGDVIILPEGSTLLDFAYHIHSELGNQCGGGTVDGIIAPLKQKLKSGQIVSILKNPNQKPKIEWLEFVTTLKAKSKITHSIAREEREKAKDIGMLLLEKEFSRLKLNFNKMLKEGILEERAKQTHFSNVFEIAVAVGYEKLDVKEAITKLLSDSKAELLKQKEQEEEFKFEKFLKKFTKSQTSSKSAVIVEGFENIEIKFAKCCNPLPGEKIIGYISVGFGITIHKIDCLNAPRKDNERAVSAVWNTAGAYRPVMFEIKVLNKIGVLSEITKMLSKMDINIENITTSKDDSVNVTEILMTLSIFNAETLKKIKENFLKINSIISVDYKRSL